MSARRNDPYLGREFVESLNEPPKEPRDTNWKIRYPNSPADHIGRPTTMWQSENEATNWADSLIEKMSTKEVEFLRACTDNLANKVKDNDYKSVVFLDRSARPLASLFTRRWHQLFPSEHLPAVKFLNFGRSEYDSDAPVCQDENYLTGILKSETFKKLKKQYEKIHGKTLVIDEVVSSGNSLFVAQRIVEELTGQPVDTCYYSQERLESKDIASDWFQWRALGTSNYDKYVKLPVHDPNAGYPVELLTESTASKIKKIKENREAEHKDAPPTAMSSFERENLHAAAFYNRYIKGLGNKVYPAPETK